MKLLVDHGTIAVNIVLDLEIAAGKSQQHRTAVLKSQWPKLCRDCGEYRGIVGMTSCCDPKIVS